MSTTTEKKPNEQKVIDALERSGEATVDEVAAAAGIGRTSVRKYLAGLEQRGRVTRVAGGREGRRKLPDRYSPVGKGPRRPATEKAGRKPRKGRGERLRPGGLDELVVGYMRDHREEGPFGAVAVARGLGRSSGAVGNCLVRLADAGEKVAQVGEQPRRYAPKKGA